MKNQNLLIQVKP